MVLRFAVRSSAAPHQGSSEANPPHWWWSEWSGLPPTQKMVKFLSDLVLGQTTAPIVVFVDEIDSTQCLPFSDDFFAAVRSCHEARATEPQFNRLTFALLGVASPTDLINDPYRTPFNVATRSICRTSPQKRSDTGRRAR